MHIIHNIYMLNTASIIFCFNACNMHPPSYPVTLLFPFLCTILSPVAVAGISVWPLLHQTSYCCQCHIPKFAKSSESSLISVLLSDV